jgi:hypothetical protein
MPFATASHVGSISACISGPPCSSHATSSVRSPRSPSARLNERTKSKERSRRAAARSRPSGCNLGRNRTPGDCARAALLVRGRRRGASDHRRRDAGSQRALATAHRSPPECQRRHAQRCDRIPQRTLLAHRWKSRRPNITTRSRDSIAAATGVGCGFIPICPIIATGCSPCSAAAMTARPSSAPSINGAARRSRLPPPTPAWW